MSHPASGLTHVDAQGNANMVDVTDKIITVRTATAQGKIAMSAQTIQAIIDNTNAKGDVLLTAKIAGIQGAKRTADLIPLCHPLALSKVDIDIEVDAANGWLSVTSMCKLSGKTGVEMEALTAVNVTLLTLFDMCKASDPAMRIFDIHVQQKTGGKSGNWQYPQEGL
ncbi:MAG: cyclic pyranopterin monophosphate synthase MoaC [Glaciecola sp.]|jgi:cyclic pyranopterin phosphate synthase